MVELEFYDPSGCLEITQRYAARLSSLDGKRIGILSGDQWQAHRTLPALKALMEADFPGIEVLPIDTFPQGEHAVGADTKVAVAEHAGLVRGDALVVGRVDHDEVVAQALVLEKLHGRGLRGREGSTC